MKPLAQRRADLKRRWAKLHARRRSTDAVERELVKVTTSLIRIANREDRKCKSV